MTLGLIIFACIIWVESHRSRVYLGWYCIRLVRISGSELDMTLYISTLWVLEQNDGTWTDYFATFVGDSSLTVVGCILSDWYASMDLNQTCIDIQYGFRTEYHDTWPEYSWYIS